MTELKGDTVSASATASTSEFAPRPPSQPKTASVSGGRKRGSVSSKTALSGSKGSLKASTPSISEATHTVKSSVEKLAITENQEHTEAETPAIASTVGDHHEHAEAQKQQPIVIETIRNDDTETDTSIVAANVSDADLAEAVACFKSYITLPGYSDSLWKPEHETAVLAFLRGIGSRRLVLHVEANVPAPAGGTSDDTESPEASGESSKASAPVAMLVLGGSLPPYKVDALQYFIRDGGGGLIQNSRAFVARVQVGTVAGGALESLLRLMNGVYVPMFLDNSGWPESLRKEFVAQMQRFMAYLTDTTHQLDGHTMLYVPQESLEDVEAAARDKDVVQRLESLLVHWTRQIKEVVNNQHNTESAETLGPLEEIQFWRSRCLDLSGISEQLTRPDVHRITEVLRLAKSSYLEQFLRLSNLIQDGSMQAQDNLRFLSSLVEPCRDLASAEPRDIAKHLQPILNCIRIIWRNSRFYSSKERLTSLLRKVSNEIINRCSAKISLEAIFKGDVYAAVSSLNESITCGETWKAVYKKNVQHIAKYCQSTWDFDESSVFAQIDAFVQRCRDLQEVCEGQMQFARKIKGGAKAPIPIFSGTHGPEIGKSLEDIEKAFEKQLNALWENRKYILDVKATRWHDDYNAFKSGVKDLEVMMQNIINSAFETANNIETKVELLGRCISFL